MTRKLSQRAREQTRVSALTETLLGLNFTDDEVSSLRRLSARLRLWYERECNGEVARSETDGRTYEVHVHNSPGGKIRRHPTRDHERSSERRLASIIAARNARVPDVPPVYTYLQTDPRGAALYIMRAGDVPNGEHVESWYSRGIVVY